MYLPAGEYTLDVSQWGSRGNVGYNASISRVEISDGESIAGLVFILSRSGVPLQDSVATMGSTVFVSTLLFARKPEKRSRIKVRKYSSERLLGR
jgi:hypothetical protein